MPLDPISAVGEALSGFFKVITPSIEEHYAQKYNDDHNHRMDEFEGIMSQPDDEHRAALLGDFVRRMCSDAGSPTGSFQGQLISIPVESFQALVIQLSESIKSEQLLGRLTFKAN